MKKCQRCPKPATVHITEVHGYDKFDEVHLCDGCGKDYLSEPAAGAAAAGAAAAADPGAKPCEACGLKFVEFRNSGRLGCPHDYDHFKDDLLPLLDSIHGDTRHAGKAPRRPPAGPGRQAELADLRKRLARAVADEAYEDAARLRDRIKRLEDG